MGASRIAAQWTTSEFGKTRKQRRTKGEWRGRGTITGFGGGAIGGGGDGREGEIGG